MKNSELYSIGHGSRSIEDFLALVKLYNIEYLIDVRSSPYSKFNPQFNKNEFAFSLKSNDIRYVFMGDNLGGRPSDLTCYDDEGKVNYIEIKHRDFYKTGIERLKTAYLQGLRVAIMCSESDPSQCHRSKLIGMTLLEEIGLNISIKHIDAHGKIKYQESVMNEINKGRNPKDLFNFVSVNTSRKSYLNKSAS